MTLIDKFFLRACVLNSGSTKRLRDEQKWKFQHDCAHLIELTGEYRNES